MQEENKLVTNPRLVLREEFDDWAILFDPDSGAGFGLNPVGVFIWKHLDGKRSIRDIRSEMDVCFDDIPEDVENDIQEFVQQLIKRGFVGHDVIEEKMS